MTAPVRALLSEVQSLTAELDQIEAAFYRCRGHSMVEGYVEYLPTEEGCLFALWDAWSRFLRRIVMAVSDGPTMGLSGAIYSPIKARNEQSVLSYLMQQKRGQRYKFVNREPNWHDESALSDIVTVLALPNSHVVIGAVTASSVILGPIVVQSPLQEIRIARNFSAHKNWKTLQDISGFSSNFTGLSEHLRARRSGVETFSEWKESIEALAAAAAQ